MNKLMFDDVSRLYSAFIEYRDIMVKPVLKQRVYMKDVLFEVSEMTELAQLFHMHKQGILYTV